MATQKLILCGVLAMAAGPVFAQTPIVGAMKLPTHAPANVSGRWRGAFDIVQPNGSVNEDSAIFILKQDGTTVTGTAGRSEANMTPLSDGKIDGDDLSFVVTVHQNVPVHFALKLEDSHLRGEATGLPVQPGSKIVVDAARWPDGSAAPEIVHIEGSLFATVSALDTKLFEAYNHCDIETMGSLIADDLEFYHDKTGLSVGKQPFLDAIKQNICGKVQRTLVPGTLEVYPLNGYGAVEIGIHRFHHPAHPEDGLGEAKFITVWQNKKGTWKMTRAISYDHEPVKQ